MNWKLVIGGLIAAGVATAGIVYKQYSAPKVSEYSAAIKAVHSWEEWQKVSVNFTMRAVEHDPTSLIRGLSDADREKAVNCSLDKTVADLKENCTSYAEFLKGLDNEYLRTALLTQNKCALTTSMMPTTRRANLVLCMQGMTPK